MQFVLGLLLLAVAHAGPCGTELGTTARWLNAFPRSVEVACPLPDPALANLKHALLRQALLVGTRDETLLYRAFISDHATDHPRWRLELEVPDALRVVITSARAYDEARDAADWRDFVTRSPIYARGIFFFMNPREVQRAEWYGTTIREVADTLRNPLGFAPLPGPEGWHVFGASRGRDHVAVNYADGTEDIPIVRSTSIMNPNDIHLALRASAKVVGTKSIPITAGQWKGSSFSFAPDVPRKFAQKDISLRDVKTVLATAPGLVRALPGASDIAGHDPTHWLLGVIDGGRLFRLNLFRRADRSFVILSGAITDDKMQAVYKKLPKVL